MEYSHEELVDMIFVLGESNKNCLLASRIYKARYPDKPRHPREETFKKLLERFTITGSVKYTKQTRSKSVLTEENEFQIMTATVENPRVSTRELSREFDMSQTSVVRILNKHRFHPYHVQLHQELLDTDYQHRLNFCHWFLNQLNNRENFLDNVLFTDEATFHRNGCVNKHNLHYYADSNPNYLRIVHNQHKWSLNVWAGIVDTHLVGPFFFEGHLNGQAYHNFLENHLLNLMDNIPLARLRQLWFQQDGAPPHYALHVRNWLDQEFPGRWIGRGGLVSWPARSPDLTPLDFFLWGYVKEIVYQEVPTTVEDMQNRIVNAFQSISPEMLIKVKDSFRKRLVKCIERGGQHFEHIL